MIHHPPYGWFCSEEEWDAYRWRRTQRAGGKGAAREVIELILKAQGRWEKAVLSPSHRSVLDLRDIVMRKVEAQLYQPSNVAP